MPSIIWSARSTPTRCLKPRSSRFARFRRDRARAANRGIKLQFMQATYAKAKSIRLAVFDVDGVLTDGTLYLTDGGEEIKAFNSLDGHGMKMLRESGVALAIITGRTSRSVELRAKNLGIELVFQGVSDKARAF